MPELPEVETTRRGIEPHIKDQTVAKVSIRCPKLRWPIPRSLYKNLPGNTILAVERRAKYLLVRFEHGTLMMHLGMTGSMRISPATRKWKKHDHFALTFTNKQQLRLHDPRKFGSVLWYRGADEQQKLLAKLGPEPLTDSFDADYLYNKSKKRSLIHI